MRSFLLFKDLSRPQENLREIEFSGSLLLLTRLTWNFVTVTGLAELVAFVCERSDEQILGERCEAGTIRSSVILVCWFFTRSIDLVATRRRLMATRRLLCEGMNWAWLILKCSVFSVCGLFAHFGL